jgi:hypothetical protein
MPKPVETEVVKLVAQYCQAVEEVVTLRVRGSVFGDLINGEVRGCSKIRCHAKHTPYCWINRHIQTKLTER